MFGLRTSGREFLKFVGFTSKMFLLLLCVTFVFRAFTSRFLSRLFRSNETNTNRHSNTPENKPVTSSRDTQEVPYDAGLEVLRILSSYQSRTSLLQDLPWYEARNAAAAAGGIVEGEEVEKRQHYARPTPSPAPQQQQQQQQQQHYATRPIPQNMYQQSLPPQAYGITSTPPPFMPVAAPLGANGGGRRYFGMGPVQGGTTGGGPGAVF